MFLLAIKFLIFRQLEWTDGTKVTVFIITYMSTIYDR